ncbi:glycoside hydrolase family 26 protein [Streptomyces sp. S5]|uniref:glycoside hydrolase family 26 protein n=1 Tax=Streptomyces sp. S5 TaxID=1456735 RepID=UPI000EF8812D|nr:glycosyl hydrolase [Streptomyces sp. S5]
MKAVSRRSLMLGASAIAITPALSVLAPPPAWARAAEKQDLVPSSGAHFGAYVYEGNDLGVSQPENLESKLGHGLGINHCFQPVDVPLHSARMRRDIAVGRIPMVSWAAGAETRLRQIVAGLHDNWIDSQVDSLAALGVPVLMRLTWEFDLRYTDAILFTAMWQYVHERFASAPQVAFVWCPTWRAYRETARAEPFYPGNAYVDWIGADGYARAREDKPEYNYRAFNLMFDAAHAFAQDCGKPFIVGETGVHRDPSNPVQAAWLAETRDVVKSDYPGLKALVYFHRDGPEGDDNWRVTVPDGGPAQQSLATIAADPYFNPAV